MYTAIYGKIDYYITMEIKEVVSFKISDSTKSYTTAVGVRMWGRGEHQFSLFSFLISLQKKKMGGSKDKTGKEKRVLMHLRQKPIVKLNNDLFGVFKVQNKNLMVQDNLSGCFMGVDLLLHSFKQKVSVEATFNYIS